MAQPTNKPETTSHYERSVRVERPTIETQSGVLETIRSSFVTPEGLSQNEYAEQVRQSIDQMVELRDIRDPQTNEVVGKQAYIKAKGTEKARLINGILENDANIKFWDDPTIRRLHLEQAINQFSPFVEKEKLDGLVEALNRSFGAINRYNRGLEQLTHLSSDELEHLGLTKEQAERVTDPIERSQLVQKVREFREHPPILTETDQKEKTSLKNRLLSKISEWRGKRKISEEKLETAKKKRSWVKRASTIAGLGLATLMLTGMAFAPNEANLRQNSESRYMQYNAVEMIETNMTRVSPEEANQIWKDYLSKNPEISDVTIYDDNGTAYKAPKVSEVDSDQVVKQRQVPTPLDNEAIVMRELPGRENSAFLATHNFNNDSTATAEKLSFGGNVDYVVVGGNLVFAATGESMDVPSSTNLSYVDKLGAQENGSPKMFYQRCGDLNLAEKLVHGITGLPIDNTDTYHAEKLVLVGITGNHESEASQKTNGKNESTGGKAAHSEHDRDRNRVAVLLESLQEEL